MKKVRDLINWQVIIWFALFLSVVTFFSCSTADEEGLEKLLEASGTTDLTTQPTPSTDVPAPIDEPVALEALTFTIDATSKEEWAYFSFMSGDTVDVEEAENSEAWDIGFQRTAVKLNGGVSGPGMGSVVMLTETTFEAVTVAPADGYRADTEDTLAIVPQSEKGWYIYTGAPTHWILPLEDRVFVVTAADGTFAKVRFVGYYKDNENKKDSGFVTFEYVHQPDRSPNF